MPAGRFRPAPAPKGKAAPRGGAKPSKAPPGPTAAFFKSPTMGATYGSQDPTVDASGNALPGSPGSPLIKGATDPFAGTPYAGMSPYQIAQKIVNDELATQAGAISAAEAQQAQYNQNALSVLSQLGVQLQSGAGQFATNYQNALANIPGGAGTPTGSSNGGAPDFNSFQAGHAAATNLIAQQGGMQPGGPSQATGNGAAQQQQDAANYLQTAQQTNPFAVLPAAYGREAQMDATLLAANQAQAMTGYSDAIQKLYAGANDAIMQEFQGIQAMFDAANGSVTAAQAAAASAAASRAAAGQKTYQWQYAQASANARDLEKQTGHIWTVDPKTLQPVEHGVSLPGYTQGVRNNATTQSVADRQRALDQADQRLAIEEQRAQTTARDAQASLAQRKAANLAVQKIQQQRLQIEKERVALQKQAAAGKGASAQTKTQVAIGKTVTAAGKWAKARAKYLASRSVTKVAGIVTGGGTLTKPMRAQVWNETYQQYATTFFAYYRSLGYAHPQNLVNKAVNRAVGWGPNG